jgi:ABC-2 type transport system permease protein
MTPSMMWVSFYTIVRKEVVRMFRIWTQTFLPPAITTALYFLIFGKFIGSQIAPINGVTYMQFIVPGLVMMAVVMQSFMNSAFTFYMAKFQKTLEEVSVSPTPYLVLIAGHVASAVIRGMLTAVIVLGVALFFTHLSIAHLFITILFVFLSSLLFALAGLINGVFANSFDTVSIFPTFVLTPLTYLGGVFYSVSVLPEIWQNISLANPILYMVNGFRYGMLGFADTNVILSLGVLSALVVVLTLVNWWIFKTGKGLRA